ncbi:MAG: hypothetical protein AAF456_18190 [Planctomycetota bacterium]
MQLLFRSLKTLAILVLASAVVPESFAQEEELPAFATWRFETTEGTEPAGVYRLSFSPDGRLVATRDRRNMVAVFDLSAQKKLCEVESHEAWVTCVTFSPDSRFFLCCARGPGAGVRAYSTANGQLEVEFGEDVLQTSFSSDGTHVYCLSEQEVETRAWPSGELVTKQAWQSDRETRLGMTSDGSSVVRVSGVRSDRQVEMSLNNLAERSIVNLGSSERVPKAAVISENRLWLAMAFHRDEVFSIWDLRDPHNSRVNLRRHESTVQSVCFSDDSRFLLSTGWDNNAVLWDVLTGEELKLLEGHTEHVNACAFSTINMLLATGASGRSDNSVIVRDLNKILFPDETLPAEFSSFEFAWQELGSEFPQPALRAVDAIVSNGDVWVEKVAAQMNDYLVEASHDEIARLIELLDSPVYRDRETATNKLMEMRAAAEDQLRAAASVAETTEARVRIQFVLRHPPTRPQMEPRLERRMHRSVFALELAATESAAALLEKISLGHPSVDIARDAADSLKRLQLRRQLAEQPAP